MKHNQELPDWQRGAESEANYLERIRLMEDWLKANKQSILQNNKPITSNEEEMVGFIDD